MVSKLVRVESTETDQQPGNETEDLPSDSAAKPKDPEDHDQATASLLLRLCDAARSSPVSGSRLIATQIPSPPNLTTEFGLPLLYGEKRPGGRVRIRVLEVHPLAEASWESPDLTGYQRIDSSDLGDRHDLEELGLHSSTHDP